MQTTERNAVPSFSSSQSSSSPIHRHDVVTSTLSSISPSSSDASVTLGEGDTTAPQDLPWSSALQAPGDSSEEDRFSTAAVSSWAELCEVESLERVLAPLMATLIVVSNLVLLAHESRVVWRTKRLIQPKLLVLALSAADLLSTAIGFLPLWILFVVSLEGEEGGTGGGGGNDHLSSSSPLPPLSSSLNPLPGPPPSSTSAGFINAQSVLNSSTSAEPPPPSSPSSFITTLRTTLTMPPPQVRPTTFTTTLPLPPPTSPAPTLTPPFPLPPGHPYPVVYSSSYAALVFLLASFWTLAQCIVVVMGVERLLALRVPFFYTARCTCGAFLAVLGLLALTSCGIGGFHLVMQLNELQQRSSNNNDNEKGSHGSSDKSEGGGSVLASETETPARVSAEPLVFAGFMVTNSLGHAVYTLVQGVVWSLVLLTCNWAVRRELRRMEERVTVVRVKDQSEYLKQLSMVHGAGREFARFVMAVNVIFLLSSSPNLVCVLLRTCRRAPSFSIQYFCWRMSHISALLNPFLYGFLRKSLRSRTRRFLNRHLPCLRAQRVGEAEAGPSSTRADRQEDMDLQHAKPASGYTCRSPNSAIIPQDPEASTLDLSD